MDRTEFLKKLYQHSEGSIELRALPSRHRTFIPLDSDLSAVNRFCDQNSGDNLFFGVATRDGTGGGKGNIVNIPVVWADVDYKDTPKETLKDRMAKFLFRPSMVLFTGGGVHLYWILREPAEKADIEAVEGVNRGIASIIGGDLNACDAARILRIPGTVNHKYSEKPECRVIYDADFTYTLDDFLCVLPEVPTERKRDDQTEGNTNGAGWLAEAMQGCKKPGRNAMAARLAGYWINKISSSETLAILKNWNQLNKPPLSDTEIEAVVKSVSRYEPTGKKKPKISIENVYTAEMMIDEYRQHLQNLKKNRFITGIRQIDQKIRGVAGGEVLTIIARAGSFKTAMLQNMLLNYVNHSSWGAVFFSIEMPIPSVTERFMQMTTALSGRQVEDSIKGETIIEDFDPALAQKQFKAQMDKLYVIPSKVSLSDISSYVKLIATQFNVKIGIIGIDYVQLIDSPGINEYEVISRVARGGKDLAKMLNIPVILLSQVSRKGGDGEIEVSLDMGRGSGALEEGADFVLGLWQANKGTKEDPEYDLICRILKNRKGPKGSRWKLELDPECFQIGFEAELYKSTKRSTKISGY